MKLSANKPLSLAGKLLPGMLPLLIFVVVEFVWGTTIGLFAALTLGLIQFVWFWFRERRLDKFILADIAFLMILGGLAILFDNALLFKLKPVFIGAALLLLIGYSAFSNIRLVMLMMQRHIKGLAVGPFESWLLQDMLKVFFWLLLAHTILILGAALWMPHAWWAAISGPGFYVLVGGLVLFSWLLNKKRKAVWSKEEWLPLVDEEGKVLGHAPRSKVHGGKNRWLHPVVHLQVVTPEGLWLQKRPMHKTVQPGKWDTAVGGHVSRDETIETTLLRETTEEIGVNPQSAVSLGRYFWRSAVENELVFVFALWYDGEIHPHPEELDGGKNWSFSEIEEAKGKDLLTPNFEEEFRRYGDVLKKMQNAKMQIIKGLV